MQDNIQLTHKEHRLSTIKFPLSIIANDIADPLNVGSLFRLSDALGVEKLYLCGDTPAPPNAKIKKASPSTAKYVAYETHASAEILVSCLKESGSFSIALETTSLSMTIGSDQFQQKIRDNQPVCLIIGSENTGVSETLLSLADMTTHIPMYGNNSSMNVISAASIVCYEISRNLL